MDDAQGEISPILESQKLIVESRRAREEFAAARQRMREAFDLASKSIGTAVPPPANRGVTDA